MTRQEIEYIVRNQRNFFDSGKTLNIEVRKKHLIQLKKTIIKYEEEIHDALNADLGKSRVESYMCEVGFLLSELSYQIRHIRSFSKKQRVKTPLAQFLSKSFQYPSPYGVTLIMSPWNYPFLLSAEPLIEAVAAGNTVVLKPSAYSPHVAAVMGKVISRVFTPEYVAVIEGGREENKTLLEMKFDYIFFTGSKAVGKMVYEKASSFFTPVTLELGGKSPCIVDGTAKIPLAARRIVWGKFLNCGQTCVAPDYILCKADRKQQLLEAIKKEIQRQFGQNPLTNENYGKIITKRHFERIVSLMDEKKIVYGGRYDETTLKIEPTIMDQVTGEDDVMGEEIFGPLLPILTYETEEEAIKIINSYEKPLALYLFSTDRKKMEDILSRVQFGGGCINDVVIHLATPYMPFGGVGESGIGSYHGKKGFETFTHYKSIVDKKNILDLPMRYQPYTPFYAKLIRFFLK